MNFRDFKRKLDVPVENIVFVGLGNESRGDDAAGLFFLQKLKEQPEFKAANFIYAGTNPENYLQQILEAHPSLVVFIDAADWDVSPGEMRWIDPAELDHIQISTHAFSIQLVENYLKAHQAMDTKYFSIQYGSIRSGTQLSDHIKENILSFFQDRYHDQS